MIKPLAGPPWEGVRGENRIDQWPLGPYTTIAHTLDILWIDSANYYLGL